MEHKSLSRRIEQYFEKGMTLIYTKHSVSEVDFYRWLPTNEFVYKRYNKNSYKTNTFRLWQTTADLLMEELTNNIVEEIDNEILHILIDKYYALPKVK
jgi:hypothetical protein